MTPKQIKARKALLAKNKEQKLIDLDWNLIGARTAKAIKRREKRKEKPIKKPVKKFVLIHSFDSSDREVTNCGIVLSKNNVKVTTVKDEISCVKCRFGVLY